MGVNSYDLRFGKGFLAKTPKDKQQTEKQIKMDFIKIKFPCTKGHHQESEDKVHNERKHTYLQLRVEHPEYVKNSYNSIIKGQTTQFKNKQKNLNRNFSQEDTQMDKHMKR